MVGGDRHRQDRQLLVLGWRNVVRGATVIANDAEHMFAVGGKAGEWSQVTRQLSGGRVALAGHERRYRARIGSSLIRVIGHAEQHEDGAQVGVAKPKRSIVIG